MSRSYKRHPVTKDKNYKFGKRLAVKAVRRDDGISNGKSYKKKFCSWNICDYRIYEGSFEKALCKWKKHWITSSFLQKKFPTWKQAYRYFITYYKFK